MTVSAGANESLQISSKTPLLPKASIHCLMRIEGSAYVPSAAMHECRTKGHMLGSPLTCDGPRSTIYGEGGPAIAATRILVESGLSCFMAVTTSVTRSKRPSSAETHVPDRSVGPAGVRGGALPPQR